MKKLIIILVIGLTLCLFSTANADLLGLHALYEGNRPDILVNNTGTDTYTPSNTLLTVSATDEKLALPGGATYFLSGPDFTTTFTLKIHVDSTGAFTGGIEGYDMVEQVTQGSVTVKDVTYGVNDILLQADVQQFGWGSFGGVPAFDFLFSTASGGLVDQGLWPASNPWTVYWNETAQGNIDWNAEDPWTLINAKGDKTVAPEPATMLLLGSGLLGIGVYARRRFSKK